jgi:two-component system response regulator ArlR
VAIQGVFCQEVREIMNHILVIMDEPDMVSLLAHSLGREGFEVIAANTGNEVLAQLYRSTPDLVLLDAMLPDMDGFEVCRRIRATRKRPLAILMLSARAAVADKVRGLESGADDYITKPFAFAELLARIRAGIRRVHEFIEPLQQLEVGDLLIDISARRVWRSGELVELTKKEYDLLEFLARNAGRVLTRESIFDRVWGWDSQANWEVIKVYINYLRVKLNAGGKVNLIHAVRGVGYVLRSEDSTPFSSVR